MFLVGSTLPIVLSILIAAWLHSRRVDSVGLGLNGRIDDVNLRFNDVNRRFDDINRDVNHRFDDMNRDISRSFDDVNHRLDEMTFVLRDIQATLKDVDRRLTVQEERGSPIIRQ